MWKEVHTGNFELINEFGQHEASVNCVEFCDYEYGLILAAGSSDSNISIMTRSQDDKWSTNTIPDAHKIGVNAISWASATPPPYSQVLYTL